MLHGWFCFLGHRHDSERQRALREGVKSLVKAAESPRPPYRIADSQLVNPPADTLKSLLSDCLPRLVRRKWVGRKASKTSKGILMPADVQVFLKISLFMLQQTFYQQPLGKKATIHQLTTMLSTSKYVIFQVIITC